MAAGPDKSKQAAPPMTPREFLRFCWTQLTSMRTALVLLFALAIAAIPGSLGANVLPQRPTNPVLVRDWIAAHPGLGEAFDRLGLFDVYGSPWFSAIYLLLMVSMVATRCSGSMSMASSSANTISVTRRWPRR